MKPLILSFLSSIFSMLGYIPIIFNIKREGVDKLIVTSLSLTSFVMLYISITELLIEGISLVNNILVSIICYLTGLLIMYILKKITFNKVGGSSLKTVGILSFICMISHNIPEGIISYITCDYDIKLGIKIITSIMIHNISEGISVAVPIYYATLSKTKSLIYTIFASMAEFFGALLAFFIFKDYIYNYIIGYLLLMVSGIMTGLVLFSLLKELSLYKYPFYKYLGIFIGCTIVILQFLIS